MLQHETNQTGDNFLIAAGTKGRTQLLSLAGRLTKDTLRSKISCKGRVCYRFMS